MKKLVILGAGGFAREVAQYIHDINLQNKVYDLHGFIDDDSEKHGMVFNNTVVLGNINMLKEQIFFKETIYCICAIANPTAKQKMVEEAIKAGMKFINIIHPTAYLGNSVQLGEGIIIGPQSILTVNIKIGNHVSINPSCGIGHDSIIGEFSTLYWNVNISGNVNVGKYVEIGSKAFIKQGLKIEEKVIIGAGAVVIQNINREKTAVGIPAKQK